MCDFWKKTMLCYLLVMLVTTTTTFGDDKTALPQMPMKVDYENTTTYRWLNKPVLESRLLDDMEDSANWTRHGDGQMSFTQQRCKDGKQSIRLVCPTTSGKPHHTGRIFGSGSVRRNIAGEDFSDYNRVSFWVYPEIEGFRTASIATFFFNEGTVKVPGPYGRNGRSHFIVKTNQWNHIVWEIAHLSRDKVTGISFAYLLQGNEPGAAETVCYDIDRLELQKVQADHFEGWNVAPGKIAFSHTGYQLGASKSAIATGIDAESFKLVDVATNKAVLTKPIQTANTHIGTFQVMDFSQFRQPGTYIIQAGDTSTQPFRIHENLWRDSIWKTINFFYCERCGTEIPGIHGSCHRDLQCAYKDKRVVINGGWHDAGDLSQSTVNTAEAAHAMFNLAQRLQKTDPVLANRLIEEGRWGLDWLLKTQMGDGYRVSMAGMNFYSDGIIGTDDDVTHEAGNDPFVNFLAASAEAVAARALRNIDPILASYAVKAAEKDWQFAVEKAQSPHLELTGAGACACVDLFKATGKQVYADKAFELAQIILDSQQRSVPEWQIPFTGFFYTSPAKKRIFYSHHRSHVQGPVVALVELCRLFPDHPQWMKWYSAVVLYSEYLKAMSEFTQPYAMLPNSVYRVDESDQATFSEQVVTGIPVGEKHYLRLFPVWYGLRGNNGTGLSQTKGLSAAAHLRRNLDLADLCQNQLQWVVGRNPFVQSLMFGEGYDYAPQYTITSGDMVGSLPVGIQTNAHSDKPYWPADSCYNYKEVWVHPSSRWLWLMCDLAGPAQITGQVAPGSAESVEFLEVNTEKTTVVKCKPNSYLFDTELPEGNYRMRHGRQERSLTLLPGENVHLDLRRDLDFSIRQQTSADGSVSIALNVKGDGDVRFDIRCDNLAVTKPQLSAELKASKPQTLTWQGKVNSTDQPWVAVIVPNDDLSQRKEIFGSVK